MTIPNITYPYQEFDDVASLPTLFSVGDHLNGFDVDLNNKLFIKLNQHAAANCVEYNILSDHLYLPSVTDRYSHLTIRWDLTKFEQYSYLPTLKNYNIHPDIKFNNFLCSFNGSPHVSRKLLAAAIHRFGWFDSNYCSKNFLHSTDVLDGHIQDLTEHQQTLYKKFFISSLSEDFFQTVYSFGHVRYDHAANIYNLEHMLTKSFLHVVSESMATSYYPTVTEKFLYSVVTRGLFLSYAPPGWHSLLEKYYGFRLYTNLFDYQFDQIQNPVTRLIGLMSMISKFSMLTVNDWHDLYEVEKDSIEYNYDHYFSGAYLKTLQTHA